jgi:hypothetical protein
MVLPLPLQGGGWEGDGFSNGKASRLASNPIPSPTLPPDQVRGRLLKGRGLSSGDDKIYFSMTNFPSFVTLTIGNCCAS